MSMLLSMVNVEWGCTITLWLMLELVELYNAEFQAFSLDVLFIANVRN